MSGYRLPSGGLIDRNRPCRFVFDGRTYDGFAGDTLASALLANGVRLFARSFKLHRPRGVFAAGVEEPSALVCAGRGGKLSPNCRATEVEVYEGLTAQPVGGWPSLTYDAMGTVLRAFGRFLPAGFYYKTFKWPKWGVFEGAIRHSAGLGAISGIADSSRYASRYAHCATLIVGSGPAGILAAFEAARRGEQVLLCEQEPRLGGRLLWDQCVIEGQTLEGAAARNWLARALEDMSSTGRVKILTRTTAVGIFDHNAVTLLERVTDHLGVEAATELPRHRLWQVRAGRVVLATGAAERPLIFSGNDVPGVMLANATRRYLTEYGVCPGRSAVVYTNNDDAYSTVDQLRSAGATVVAVVDTRGTLSSHARRALDAGVRIIFGANIVRTRGGATLCGVVVRSNDGELTTLTADLLAVSGGFSPVLQLYTQAGGTLTWDAHEQQFRPGNCEAALEVVGDAAGTSTGIQAQVLPSEGHHAYIDLQHDVSLADVELSVRENLTSVEHLKRYTTLGMATDQGKTSSVNGMLALGALTGRGPSTVGTTKFRFPYTPVALGAFAGQRRGPLFSPVRRLPLHDWHLSHGADLEEYGGWLRPARYRRDRESEHAAEQREALTVRTSGGLFDGSPLGKIEVAGPDAAKFLDHIYANTISTLKTGALRYGLMLNELGVIIDDGVVARLAEDRFLVGTTSSGAGRIFGMLEEWLQCEWTSWQVLIAPVTTAFSVPTITGPRARAVLESLGADFSLAPADFPHMTFREGTLAGIPVRVSRVSFTGEVSFELAVRNALASTLWERLADKGAEEGITPVGIEAWNLLRLEKGYLHVGGDTDGSTSPDDVGWGHIHRRTVDFVGRRSLLRPENRRTDRHQLVGLAPTNAAELPVGAHIALPGSKCSDGYITSAGYSPTLQRWVALAMIRGGRGHEGEVVRILSDSFSHTAKIAPLCAYDPDGARLRG
jgi:sarcosine oxidase, subunit alpha